MSNRTRTRVRFETPDGATVHATPESAKETVEGRPFVWLKRRRSGAITKAFPTGDLR